MSGWIQATMQQNTIVREKIVNSKHCASGYDMYDFSEVTSDLAILRSQLFTLNVGEKPKPNNHVTATWDPQWDIFTHF